MRKFLTMALTAVCSLLCTSACAADKTDKETTVNDEVMNNDEKSAKSSSGKEMKKIVVFFSHPGENYNVGYIEKGNTHIIADMIADGSGADIYEIVPEKSYPKDSYDECIDIAKKELQADLRPAIKGDVNIEDYDVIFMGYPNWWGNPPMCVYTFIEKHDWTGKTVIPFITHEGSGMGGTDLKIAAACKGAETLTGEGLAIQGKVAQENHDAARKSVDRWLTGLKMAK